LDPGLSLQDNGRNPRCKDFTHCAGHPLTDTGLHWGDVRMYGMLACFSPYVWGGGLHLTLSLPSWSICCWPWIVSSSTKGLVSQFLSIFTNTPPYTCMYMYGWIYVYFV